MSGLSLTLIMDLLVVGLLAATIFYAVRLSRYLKLFRDSRKDLEKLIGDLSQNIVRAESAIDGLRDAARHSGRDLQSVINDAQALTEELQIMTESGENIARRLEKTTTRARPRPGASGGQDAESSPPVKGRLKRQRLPDNGQPEDGYRSGGNASPMAGFSIRDPELDDDRDAEDGDFPVSENNGFDNDSAFFGDADDDMPAELGSKAEQELYEALKKRRRETETGGVS